MELSSKILQNFTLDGAKKLTGLNFNQYKLEPVGKKYQYLDLLYKCKQLVTLDSPLWSGFMQAFFGIQEAIKNTTIVFLPMIDLSPTDLYCVYSSLKYAESIAKKNNQIPVITFDQAL